VDAQEFSPVDALESASAADVVTWCVVLLAHHARVYMGLIPGKGRVDLDQARLAIDAAGALTDLLQNHLPGDRLSELLMHVADVRLNYLEASRRSQG
jgi:hypothetical protein